MPIWAWVLIAVGGVAFLALVALEAAALRRTGGLRGQFGPEYDRVVGTAESKRRAEAKLAAREERREQLELRPLSLATREHYLERWQAAQAEFVDDPRAAVASADSLIQSLMTERGYRVEAFEQRAADVSVDHPQVVENYRQGHRLAQASANGGSSTEDLRQAMRHYRVLFDELVEPGREQPSERDPRGDGRAERSLEGAGDRTVR